MPISLVLLAGKSGLWKLTHRFGALLFIPFGLWDNSPIPSLGGSDWLLIVLAAANRDRWWLYVLAATAASIAGAWPMYRIGEKSGEKALDEKLGPRRSKKIRDAFEKHGALAMFVGAIAPPPMPTSAFIGTAGAMKMPPKRFLMALSSGRLLRFAVIGWVASRYGRHIFQFLTKYYKPALFTLLALGIAGGLVALYYWRKARHNKKSEELATQRPKPQAA